MYLLFFLNCKAKGRLQSRMDNSFQMRGLINRGLEVAIPKLTASGNNFLNVVPCSPRNSASFITSDQCGGIARLLNLFREHNLPCLSDATTANCVPIKHIFQSLIGSGSCNTECRYRPV